MLKRNSIVKFALLAIIAILGILLCVCPFSVPYSADVYNGIIPAINKGMDINGGVSALYECTLANGSTDGLSTSIDNSISKVQDMFASEKFSELQVTRQGGNKLYVLASGQYATEFNEAFSYLEDGKELTFTAVELDSQGKTVDGESVSKAYVDYDYEGQTYGVKIEFTKQGLEELKELKEYAKSLSNDSVYLYLGDLVKENTLAEVKVEDLGEESIFITASTTGSYKTSTADEARAIAYSIIGGAIDVDLELLEVSPISPILGVNTKTYISIALGVIVLATFACLVVRYRHLGLLAVLALTFNLILFSFFMMSIPFITLNLAGIIGAIAGFALSVFALVMLFEKMKEEYALGKKIHLSCKGGFKKALWPILDSHFIMILVSLFIWIFAPAMLKGFAISMIVGALLSMFTSLVLMRWFVKEYLRINSTKAKKLALYRDKSIKEKDEEVQIISEEVATSVYEGGSRE